MYNNIKVLLLKIIIFFFIYPQIVYSQTNHSSYPRTCIRKIYLYYKDLTIISDSLFISQSKINNWKNQFPKIFKDSCSVTYQYIKFLKIVDKKLRGVLISKDSLTSATIYLHNQYIFLKKNFNNKILSSDERLFFKKLSYRIIFLLNRLRDIQILDYDFESLPPIKLDTIEHKIKQTMYNQFIDLYKSEPTDSTNNLFLHARKISRKMIDDVSIQQLRNALQKMLKYIEITKNEKNSKIVIRNICAQIESVLLQEKYYEKLKKQTNIDTTLIDIVEKEKQKIILMIEELYSYYKDQNIENSKLTSFIKNLRYIFQMRYSYGSQKELEKLYKIFREVLPSENPDYSKVTAYYNNKLNKKILNDFSWDQALFIYAYSKQKQLLTQYQTLNEIYARDDDLRKKFKLNLSREPKFKDEIDFLLARLREDIFGKKDTKYLKLMAQLGIKGYPVAALRFVNGYKEKIKNGTVNHDSKNYLNYCRLLSRLNNLIDDGLEENYSSVKGRLNNIKKLYFPLKSSIPDSIKNERFIPFTETLDKIRSTEGFFYVWLKTLQYNIDKLKLSSIENKNKPPTRLMNSDLIKLVPIRNLPKLNVTFNIQSVCDHLKLGDCNSDFLRNNPERSQYPEKNINIQDTINQYSYRYFYDPDEDTSDNMQFKFVFNSDSCIADTILYSFAKDPRFYDVFLGPRMIPDKNTIKKNSIKEKNMQDFSINKNRNQTTYDLAGNDGLVKSIFNQKQEINNTQFILDYHENKLFIRGQSQSKTLLGKPKYMAGYRNNNNAYLFITGIFADTSSPYIQVFRYNYNGNPPFKKLIINTNTTTPFPLEAKFSGICINNLNKEKEVKKLWVCDKSNSMLRSYSIHIIDDTLNLHSSTIIKEKYIRMPHKIAIDSLNILYIIDRVGGLKIITENGHLLWPRKNKDFKMYNEYFKHPIDIYSSNDTTYLYNRDEKIISFGIRQEKDK